MVSRRSPVTAEPNDPGSCTTDVRQHVLAHVPFFAGLTPEQIGDIDRRCRVEDFEPGQAVHHVGQPARRLFVIAAGTAKLVRPVLDGTEVLLDLMRPGDFFGALPALGTDTYTDSVWALTPLCVLSLDGASFDKILDEHPSVARSGLRVMAQRLEQAQTHIHAMAAANSQQRIAGALVMLARRVGVRRRDGLLLDLPLARDDLASLTGTASETVSRTLAQLQRDGVINTGRRWIEITDLVELERLATI
jgi:CRP/FNR family transcriptional regulator, nitrogen oxide reductase regulator